MKIKNVFSFLLIFLFLLNGCSDDDGYSDVDGLAPTLVLGSSNIQTEPGREIVIQATIADNDGLRSVNLKNTAFDLDKTIDLTLDSILYSYDLSYKYTTVEDIEGDNFSVVITATDLGGRSVSETVLVTMDGDFTSPVFTSSPDTRTYILIEDGASEASYTLGFTVTDNKGFSAVYITITNDEDGTEYYSEEVTGFTDSGTTLEYSNTITFPAEAINYTLEIRAVDELENETSAASTLYVTDLPDFDYMYLADVATVAELNSDVYGVPMLIDHTGTYEYTAYYYCETAGTEVRFIPQKTAFTPICFGLDPSDSNVLIRSTNADPITLPSVGYYKIVFNIQSGEYSVSTYEPTDDPVAIGEERYINTAADGTYTLSLCLAGEGFSGVASWSTSNGVSLTQSSANPYLFYAEVTLTAGTSVSFTISPYHPWGWWPEPYWRFSNDENITTDTNVLNGGSNYSLSVPATGKYMFKFDTHLLRSKIYKIN